VTRSRPEKFGFTAVFVALCVSLSTGQERAPVDPWDVGELIVAGQYDRAEAVARTDLQRLTALQGEARTLKLANAVDILVSALVLNGRGSQTDTLTLARKALGIREALLGPGHADLLPSLLNLGDALVEAGEFDQAIVTIKRGVAIAERSGARDSTVVAETQHHLGSALSAGRRYDDALRSLERSLRAKEKTLEPRSLSIARTLEEIALVFQRKGDYEPAGAHIRRAATLQEGASLDHPAYVRTLNLLAQQLWFEGHLQESRIASERAVELAERVLRPDHPMVALSLRYLAATLAALGDLGRALALKERALGVAQRNFGQTHHVTGEYLHSLGFAEFDNGDYAKARRHIQQALRIYQARYGMWHEYVASALTVLALTDAALGDYTNAHREQARAVAINARVGGPNHPFVATALTELATVHRLEGRPDQAIPLLERALRIRESNPVVNYTEVARTLADLAAMLMEAGRWERAQALARRARDICNSVGAADEQQCGTVLAIYGEIQQRRGDYAAAKEYYQRAVQIRREVFGSSHPLSAEVQEGLALAAAGLGDAPAAIANALQVEETGRQHLRTTLRALSERQSLTYAATRPKGLDLAISLAGPDKDTITRVFDALVRSRALVLDEMAARHRLRTDASGDLAPLWTSLTSARQRLANLVVRGPSDQRPEQYLKLVEDARRAKERAETALAEKSATFRNELAREEIGLDAVRKALPLGSALVAFVRYDRTVIADTKTPTGTPGKRLRTVPSYMAFVAHSERPDVSMVPLGAAASLETLVVKWHAETVGIIRASSQPEAERTYRVAGAQLRQRVWDPIAAHLKDAINVFVVPDGALNVVTLAALPTGRTTYLVDNGPVIQYLSAERDLVTGPSQSSSGRGLLALGGAAFDDSTSFSAARPAAKATAVPASAGKTTRGTCGDLPSLHFDPLEATGREVQDVASLWTGSPIELLQNGSANERAFKQSAPGRRVLHLATHGFFLGSDCAIAPAGTRGVGGLSRATTTRSNADTADNPLLLSGLALAGANRRAAAGPKDEDGILTAEEVASLNLEGVDWAVLSACDTGLGVVQAGEGVFGLRRAFLVAGVHTVIMSLWQVEDESARAWMRALYEGRLKNKLNTAQAVQQASLTVLRDRRAAKQTTHPFYWAGFAAAGDWR
jgi:CHAT domain-containing protein/tetratricopeptide (TPR) repeat protein